MEAIWHQMTSVTGNAIKSVSHRLGIALSSALSDLNAYGFRANSAAHNAFVR